MFVFYGGSSTAPTLADAEVIYGANYYDYIGKQDTISAFGDLDGDGTDDWGFGSGYANNYAGAAWVYYGGTSTSWATTADADASFVGANSYSYFGDQVKGGADIDGDGYDDLMVNDELGGYIWSGGATRLTDADTYSISITDSSISYGYFDSSDSQIGDYNGDGNADVTLANYANASSTGAVWTFNGPLSAGSYDVTGADSSLTGSANYSYFGRSSGTGDFNGDGSMDLAIGSFGDDAVYLFSGGAP
jgi:hypothetical protein